MIIFYPKGNVQAHSYYRFGFMLNRIKIVLVGTSHPGNIGSAARAMKTMGLTRLVLVSPQKFPHHNAIEMASGAVDVLEEAEVVDTLAEALADVHLAIGSSARPREIKLPMLSMDEFAPHAAKQSLDSNIAIVFGRERTGLTNEELRCCDFHTMVPTNPEYGSLNLSQAVQLFGYELRKQYLKDVQSELPATKPLPLATSTDLERMFIHLEQTLLLTDFLATDQPNKVMAKLKRLFKRSQLEEADVNLLRGIFSSVKSLSQQGKY